MSAERYDVAVVGLGAMGSMALWRLAARGARVIGFDRFDPPHDLGSSHGESRMIRSAYAEGEFYVPLLGEAFALWRELEHEAGTALLTLTGGLMIGPPEGTLVAGALASARAHRLEHRVLDAQAVRRDHPQHRVADTDVALWEAAAGFLRPEAAIAAALGRARRAGAAVHPGARVTAVDADAGGVRVCTGERRVEAGHAIVAAGAWIGALLPRIDPHLMVERQVLAWFPVSDPARFDPGSCCVWIHELGDGRLRYGFPSLDGTLVKVAVHHEGAATTADAIDRTVHDADLDPLRSFVAEHLAGVDTRSVRATVCMYSNTPDERFLVGALADSPRVIALGGCSGHSFKFASILGDVAADLALEGTTARTVEAFGLDRDALGG